MDRVTPTRSTFSSGLVVLYCLGPAAMKMDARARTLAKQCLENRRRLDVQAIRGHTQMTEVDTPSGLGADHVAQDGLAHLDTTVWWLYSTGLIALVALDKFLELRYDLLPAALSYFLPHEIGRDARSELLLFSFR